MFCLYNDGWSSSKTKTTPKFTFILQFKCFSKMGKTFKCFSILILFSTTIYTLQRFVILFVSGCVVLVLDQNPYVYSWFDFKLDSSHKKPISSYPISSVIFLTACGFVSLRFQERSRKNSTWYHSPGFAEQQDLRDQRKRLQRPEESPSEIFNYLLFPLFSLLFSLSFINGLNWIVEAMTFLKPLLNPSNPHGTKPISLW